MATLSGVRVGLGPFMAGRSLQGGLAAGLYAASPYPDSEKPRYIVVVLLATLGHGHGLDSHWPRGQCEVAEFFVTRIPQSVQLKEWQHGTNNLVRGVG